MIDYIDCVKGLRESQEADHDQRETGRECAHFIHDDDGQWEQNVISNLQNRPRYTFDKTTPIIDMIVGEIESNDFGVKVSPADGESSKDNAQMLTGIIRGIEYSSNANDLYNRNMRRCVVSGFDAWRVRNEWKKGTFEQEALIEGIPNALDRVWFDAGSVNVDASDAKHAWVLTALTTDQYTNKYPEGSKQTIGEDRYNQRYWEKKTYIVVGEYYYAKETEVALVLFDNGKVVDASNKPLMQMMELNGFKEMRRRKEVQHKWFVREFDGADYLTEETETVFKSCPVIPQYGNFDVLEDKIIWQGVVARMRDPQRVHNYAKSREIEEGALAPRKKYWMTKEQAAGHMNSLRNMNTSANPVEFYTHVDGQLPPTQQGTNDINPHLNTLSVTTANDIESTAGMYGASMAANPMMQSGVAIGMQQDKGDTGNIKWHKVLERSIQRTAEVLLEIIPDVYDTQRQVPTMAEDGAVDFVGINTPEYVDGKVEVSNSTKDGNYNVVVDIGAGFNNAQKESVATLLEVAAIKPDILEIGADILLNNIDAPAMGALAERYRTKMVAQGLIPEDQLTEEELEELQAQQANQQQQPDPMMIAAQAEMMKAQADMKGQQNKETELQIQMAKLQTEVQGKQEKLQSETQLNVAKISQEQQKIDNSKQDTDYKNALALAKLELEAGRDLNKDVKDNVLVFDTETGDFV